MTLACILIECKSLNVFLLKNVIYFVLSKIHQERRCALRLIGSSLSGLMDRYLRLSVKLQKDVLTKRNSWEQNGCYFYLSMLRGI